MKLRKKVTIIECPLCAGQLAHVKIWGSDREFIKCKNGCTSEAINKKMKQLYRLPPPKKLKELVSDQFFMEVIKYARSIGKTIKKEDKAHELIVWNRNRGVRL